MELSEGCPRGHPRTPPDTEALAAKNRRRRVARALARALLMAAPGTFTMQTNANHPHRFPLMIACLAAAFGCDPVDDSPADGRSQVADELPAPAREQTDEDSSRDLSRQRQLGGQVVAELSLEGGTRVTFIELTDTTGHHGVGVLEEVPRGAASLADFDELADASARDIFWAVSEPGAPIPPELADSGADAAERPAQGWVLDAIASGGVLKFRGTCDTDSVFSNYVTNKGYDHDVLRLNQHPDVSSYFIPDSYAPGNGQLLDGYMYSPNGVDNGSYFYNIERYYSRVGACRISGHNVVNNWEIGPMVRIAYRDANNSAWANVVSTDIDWGDSQVTFALHWTGGGGWDWRTQIEMAAWDDIYDIGHAYND